MTGLRPTTGRLGAPHSIPRQLSKASWMASVVPLQLPTRAFAGHADPESLLCPEASPVRVVLAASLPSAPCRSRTHGSCPCSSREISSGLKTRNPAVGAAEEDTASLWLGVLLGARFSLVPRSEGLGLLEHRGLLTRPAAS